MKKFVLLFLAFLISFSPAYALNRGEIRSIIRRHIGDAPNPKIKYTNAQLNDYINEAVRDVNNVTWGLQSSETATLVSGTTYYTLTGNAMAIKRARFNNKPLVETTIEELDRTKPSWQGSLGIPTNYFLDDTYQQQIGIYPVPTSTVAASTGTLTVYYYQMPTAMTLDSDTPWGASNLRMQPYQDVIVYFVCYRVFLLEGRMDKATSYRNEYEARLVVMRERIGSKPNYNPGFTGTQNR